MYEGRNIFYFHGNKELWEGLFSMFYIHVYFNIGILGDNYSKYKPAFFPMNINNGKALNYSNNYEDIDEFLSLKSVSKCIEILENTSKVYEDDLKDIFKFMFSLFALFIQHKMNNNTKISYKYMDDKTFNCFNKISTYLKSIRGKEFNEDKISKLEYFSLISISKFDHIRYVHDHISMTHYKSENNIISTFFKGIHQCSLEDCYIASFTKNINNDRMWHDYTNYKGYCLEFNDYAVNGKLNNENIKLHLKKVIYDKPFEFNFFQCLGKLSVPQITNMFYKYNFKKDEFNLINGLKKRYYDWSNKASLVKSKYWKDQKEYRLLITDFMQGYKNKQSRIFEYKFSDLKSLTFGPNMPTDMEFNITNIIEQKCENNGLSSFPLYRMVRNNKTGLLQRNLIGKVK
ncbi:DUF2971 domain-containing protein [Apilactobacillus micheneri]|uniref:DUF2971 domain-containing protein n=1 Tax=Apilactobacillus micheneri TaxID=1899430 RepID=UPI00112C6686|nr:DUF2971 domain-containing protein [Apilactobacillus micheneri]TPR50451.1 DUF2971 domain-containing protein [Apilactobacillus micheneri]